MTRHLFTRVFALSALVAGLAESGEIKKLSFDVLKTSEDGIGIFINKTLAQPAFDGSAVEPLMIGTITSTVDRKAVVRRLAKGLFTFGMRADLGPDVDLGALLAQAMRTGAPAMGLKIQSGESTAWKVSGTVKDAVLESGQLTNYGPVFCSGYLDVELTVTKGGEVKPMRVRSHHMFDLSVRSAGLGLAATIQFTSQEILARLNREFLKAPPHAHIAGLLADLKAGGRKTKPYEIARVGLSGTSDAVPVLLKLLPDAKYWVRVRIIDALANLASPAALPLLAQRYANEDTTARYNTLKAFDYIGGEEALALVKKLGLTDSDKACVNLAERVVK